MPEYEVLDEESVVARYRRREKNNVVDVTLPKEVWEHLKLGDKGIIGFKRVKRGGRLYALVGQVETVF